MYKIVIILHLISGVILLMHQNNHIYIYLNKINFLTYYFNI